MNLNTIDPREIAERQGCPACVEKRAHSDVEWKNHPFAGHGFVKEMGWSHPNLEPVINPELIGVTK